MYFNCEANEWLFFEVSLRDLFSPMLEVYLSFDMRLIQFSYDVRVVLFLIQA